MHTIYLPKSKWNKKKIKFCNSTISSFFFLFFFLKRRETTTTTTTTKGIILYKTRFFDYYVRRSTRPGGRRYSLLRKITGHLVKTLIIYRPIPCCANPRNFSNNYPPPFLPPPLLLVLLLLVVVVPTTTAYAEKPPQIQSLSLMPFARRSIFFTYT